MPIHSMASATISFGLVSIPVKVYSATQSQAAISFHLLHKACGTRVKQQYICPKDEEIVPRTEMVKGYEFQKDRYVIFSPEELKALDEASTNAIEITEFLPLGEVDPLYFDRAYYLGPDKGGDKPYTLLAAALQESGRAAVAKYSARGKQYLVLLRPLGERLVMQELHYADEVRAIDEVPVHKAPVKPAELKLALQLVDQITSEHFNPENYTDEVKARVQAAIDRKVEGEEISISAPEAPRAEVIDIMQALKESLAKGAKKPAAGERKPAKRSPRAPEAKRGRAKGSKE